MDEQPRVRTVIVDIGREPETVDHTTSALSAAGVPILGIELAQHLDRWEARLATTEPEKAGFVLEAIGLEPTLRNPIDGLIDRLDARLAHLLQHAERVGRHVIDRIKPR